eukprot:COSAG02_NODE_619_length_19446_cov_9.557141_18_plen_52_part_00
MIESHRRSFLALPSSNSLQDDNPGQSGSIRSLKSLICTRAAVREFNFSKAA